MVAAAVRVAATIVVSEAVRVVATTVLQGGGGCESGGGHDCEGDGVATAATVVWQWRQN